MATGFNFDEAGARRIVRMVRDGERLLYQVQRAFKSGGQRLDLFGTRLVRVTDVPEPGTNDEYLADILDANILSDSDSDPINIRVVNLAEEPGADRLLSVDQRIVCWRAGPAILEQEGYTLDSEAEDTDAVFATLSTGARGSTATVRVSAVPAATDFQAGAGDGQTPCYALYTGEILDSDFPTETEDPEDVPNTLQFFNLLEHPGREALLREGDLVQVFRCPTSAIAALGAELDAAFAFREEVIEGDNVEQSTDWICLDRGKWAPSFLVKVTEAPDDAQGAYTAEVLDQQYADDPLEVTFFHLGEEGSGEVLLAVDAIVPVWFVPNDTLAELGFEPDDSQLNYATAASATSAGGGGRLAQISTVASGEQEAYTVDLLDSDFATTPNQVQAFNLEEESGSGVLAGSGNIVAIFPVADEALTDLGFTPLGGQNYGFTRRSTTGTLTVRDNADTPTVVNDVVTLTFEEDHFLVEEGDDPDEAVITAKVFDGATDLLPGTEGIVPAPAAGDDVKALRGNATFGYFVRIAKESDGAPSYSDVHTAIFHADVCTLTQPNAGEFQVDLRTMGAATSMAAGRRGIVGQPQAGDEKKFWRGDATWARVYQQWKEEDGAPVVDEVLTVILESPYFVITDNTGGSVTVSIDAFVGTDGVGTDGELGLVPQPVSAADDINKFLNGGGNWEYAFIKVEDDDSYSEFTDTFVFNVLHFALTNPNPFETRIDLQTFTGATSMVNGSGGGVPPPLIADELKFLRGDGTWATPSSSGSITVQESHGGGASYSSVTTVIFLSAATDGGPFKVTQPGAGQAQIQPIWAGAGDLQAHAAMASAGSVTKFAYADHIHPWAVVNLLDGAQHGDTAAGTPALGSIPAGDGSLWQSFAAGSNEYVLIADNGQANGLKWGTRAPVDAEYVVLSTNATLLNERVLDDGTYTTLTDNGAGSTVVIDVDIAAVIAAVSAGGVIPAGTNNGDMLIWNTGGGGSWQVLPVGTNGQVLTISGGVPTWV